MSVSYAQTRNGGVGNEEAGDAADKADAAAEAEADARAESEDAYGAEDAGEDDADAQSDGNTNKKWKPSADTRDLIHACNAGGGHELRATPVRFVCPGRLYDPPPGLGPRPLGC